MIRISPLDGNVDSYYKVGCFWNEKSFENEVCILKASWCLMTIILFGVLEGGPCSSSQMVEDLAELGFFSSKCIETSQALACQKALVYTEALQREAALNGNYACQTRLLGLGSDLLMISLQSEHSRSALRMFEEVKLHCQKVGFGK